MVAVYVRFPNMMPSILKCRTRSIKWYLTSLITSSLFMYILLHINKVDLKRDLLLNHLDVKLVFEKVQHVQHTVNLAARSEYTVNNFSKVFQTWKASSKALCVSKNFIGYFNQFAYLQNVIVKPRNFIGSKGGVKMDTVMNQDESLEFLKLKTGSFHVNCGTEKTKTEVYKFYTDRNHLNEYFRSTLFTNKSKSTNIVKENMFTIAVTRYEYVNLYHTMTDFYNAYLMMAFFNKTADEVNIMFVDAHPEGSLDTTWSTLFHSFLWVGNLKNDTQYKEMVWNILGYHSPMYVTSKYGQLPLSEEFRKFFLNRHGVDSGYKLNCNKLNILFIWRRDYIAHPRNPTGLVWRKIKNEKEVIEKLSKKFPNTNITGHQMDALSMRVQMTYIGHTDILIGMHGAGLTLATLIPKHAALIEMFPSYVSTSNMHYQAIANWRNLHYQRWQNVDQKLELPNRYTILNIPAVEKLIANAMTGIGCSII